MPETIHSRQFNFQSETLGYFGVSCDTPCRPSSFGLRCAGNCSLPLSPWVFFMSLGAHVTKTTDSGSKQLFNWLDFFIYVMISLPSM